MREYSRLVQHDFSFSLRERQRALRAAVHVRKLAISIKRQCRLGQFDLSPQESGFRHVMDSFIWCPFVG